MCTSMCRNSIKAYQIVIAYQECGLVLYDIARRTDRHSSTEMRIWKQRVAEGHTEH